VDNRTDIILFFVIIISVGSREYHIYRLF